MILKCESCIESWIFPTFFDWLLFIPGPRPLRVSPHNECPVFCNWANLPFLSILNLLFYLHLVSFLLCDRIIHCYNMKGDVCWLIFVIFFPVGRNHPLILGNNNENLPRIISIIGEALSREAVEEESDCYPRMINIVRQLQVSRCWIYGERIIKGTSHLKLIWI